MNLRRRLLIEWALIALFGTLAVILATHWRGTSAFDNLVYDQLSSISRPKPDDKDPVDQHRRSQSGTRWQVALEPEYPCHN
jgi:hypothetical protein